MIVPLVRVVDLFRNGIGTKINNSEWLSKSSFQTALELTLSIVCISIAWVV